MLFRSCHIKQSLERASVNGKSIFGHSSLLPSGSVTIRFASLDHIALYLTNILVSFIYFHFHYFKLLISAFYRLAPGLG